MRTLMLLTVVLCQARYDGYAQEGGRDSGTEGKPMLFLRWRRVVESGRIYNSAWGALEPHFGLLSRRRLFDCDADGEKLDKFLRDNTDAALVVTFGEEAAHHVVRSLPRAILLKVGNSGDGAVSTRADRERVASLLHLFHPGARKVALFGPSAEKEELPGFSVRPCATPEEARGCDLAWISEGCDFPAGKLRAALDPMRIPLVSTCDTQEEDAALRVRPDEVALGRSLAAAALRWARLSGEGEHELKPHPPITITRMRISLDLRAARAAGHVVPYSLLARADSIRR